MRVCVRVCNSVSYVLDDIGKYINAFRTHQFFLCYEYFSFIFCIYMSTLHDMVEQQILVVLVGHGNTSTFIHFVYGQ